MSKILFKSVLVVILFHALIPHPHSSELSEQEHIDLHQQNSSFFGLLKSVLHEGIDESLDHLYLTEQGETKELEQKFSKPVITYSVSQKTADRKNLIVVPFWGLHNYCEFFIVILNGERGPPLFS